MCNIAHHADIGGMVPGSMAGGMSEIYQEGLALPGREAFPRRRAASGPDGRLLLNVRVPQERRGDYFAQVAACRLGERRVCARFSATYGAPIMLAAFDEIVERTPNACAPRSRRIPEATLRFPGFDGR